MKWLSFMPWRSLALAAAALAVAAAPEIVGLLRLDQSAVLGGEIWRLWTGHLVHGSAQHLAWNVAALIGLGFLFERAIGRNFTALVLIGGAVVGAGVFVLQPEIDTYLGLSGVLNTIWVGGAVIAARGERGWMRAVYFVAVAAGLSKILFEAWTGLSIFTDPGALGGRPLVLAHALGSLAGCAILSLDGPAEPRPPRLRRTAFRSRTCRSEPGPARLQDAVLRIESVTVLGDVGDRQVIESSRSR